MGGNLRHALSGPAAGCAAQHPPQETAHQRLVPPHEFAECRAIVLVEEPPASLPYAAAAVADTVLFKTYRVALVFEDVEI